MIARRVVLPIGLLSSALLGAGACGGRQDIWSQSPTSATVQEVSGALAIVDDAAHRVALLHPGVDQTLETSFVPIGHNAVATGCSPDGTELFVLSMGDATQLKPTDERPSLSLIPVSGGAPTRFTLPDVFTSMAVDPNGTRIVLSASGSGGSYAGSFIKNPNELVLVDYSQTGSRSAVTRRTLPSLQGSYPKRLTFAPGMNLEGGTRELLIIESERDVMVLDLDHPDAPEITMPISDRFTQANSLSPDAIAIDEGVVGVSPPRIAVRARSEDIVLFSLIASGERAPQNDFTAVPTTLAVGGVPTDFSFVQTEQGGRLAVLVPGYALLINPSDSDTVKTALADGYNSISIASKSGGSDVAILYGAQTSNAVALWNLGAAFDPSSPVLNPPQRISLSGNIASVIDVPNTSRKILKTTQNVLYVFDLDRQTASPLTTSHQVEIRITRDGSQSWAFVPGQQDLARVDLAGPHVETLTIDQSVADVFELDRGLSGRALVVLQGRPLGTQTASFGWRSGTWNATEGITVFDAADPNPTKARHYAAMLLSGLLP